VPLRKRLGSTDKIFVAPSDDTNGIGIYEWVSEGRPNRLRHIPYLS
jgi:hypothetical protein